MAIITKKITVDVAADNIFRSIVAKQYDTNSRFIEARLTNEGEEINVNPTSTVLINARREDNEAKPFEGVVNEDGTITVPITYWMLELDGEVVCDISIIDSDESKLTTTSFTIKVEAASCSDEEIGDSEDYDILTRLILECNDATKAAQESVGLNAHIIEALGTAQNHILIGRNLLRKTNRGVENWSFHSPLNEVDHTLEAVTEDDTNALKLVVKEEGAEWAVLTYSLVDTLPKLKPYDYYTLSFDMKTDIGESFDINICTVGSESTLVTERFYGRTTGNETWEHFVWRFYTNDLSKRNASNWRDIVLRFGVKNGTGYRIIKDLKLERGRDETQWCPAPEDAVEGFPQLTSNTEKNFDILEQFVLDCRANQSSVVSTTRVSTVGLLAIAWVGDESPYRQVVTIPGITANSKVDLNPSVEQLAIFHQKDLAFVTDNQGGIVTAYALGDKPTNDYTIQVTITEVNV